MLKIGNLELARVPRIAAVLTDEGVRLHGRVAAELADLVELRIDQFRNHDSAYATQVCREARSIGRPLLATVRCADEGGCATLDDATRVALYEAVTPFVDAVDVELRTPIRDRVVTAAHCARKPVIVSFHDFDGTPPKEDLAHLIAEGKHAGGDIVKIATTANSPEDTEMLLRLLLEYRRKHLIVIAMGPYGAISRVFFPIFGSLVTYGFVDRPVAPGQLSLQDLRDAIERYRFQEPD